MSHHERYLLLHRNRIQHCQGNKTYIDKSDQEYFLDGRNIIDIPSFYLSLGAAIHGENGYFGTCLDSLKDCLCGVTSHLSRTPQAAPVSSNVIS